MRYGVWGFVIAAVLAVCAREASARSDLAPRFDPRAPGAGAPADTVRREVSTFGDDKQLVEDARYTVRVASLVIEATVERLCLPSPRAEVSVAATLKGSADPEQLTIDLAKAPLGRWPREGERKILCLARRGRGGYELANFHASILPSTRSTLKTIEGWLAKRGPAPPAPNPYAEQVAASETMLTGLLDNVRAAPEERFAAVGTFEVKGSLLGYGAYRAPVIVYFPATEEKAELPQAGRCLLFLKGNRTDGGFTVIDAVRLTDAMLEAKVKKQSMAALGSRKGTFTTIQATLAEWQASWNARDIDRCIRCYSRKNRLRGQYDAGGEAARELAGQLKSFCGKIGLLIERIRVAPGRGRPDNVAAPIPGRAGEVDGDERSRPLETADVTVEIALSARDLIERCRATMKFAREDGEWLIREEGF